MAQQLYCLQHDHSSPAHQLQYSMHPLYHHTADPFGDLLAHIGLHQHLDDDNQLHIALLASSTHMELASSPARDASVKVNQASLS